MKVADAMTSREELVTVSLPGTRDDALEYLKAEEFSSVPVVKTEDGVERYRGLLSREDLIEQPAEDQIALLMGDGPTTTVDDDLTDIANLMVSEGARRVPVVKQATAGENAFETLEGIITVTDIVRAIADGDVNVSATANEVATREVNTTYENSPLVVVEREIAHANVPYAVVLDDKGDPNGMVTEVDIISVARVVEGEEEIGDSIA
ncbi:MAG: CBS domain-containing protein, partial [Halobacteriaceae archaeon]